MHWWPQWWVSVPPDMLSNEGKCEVDTKFNIILSTQEGDHSHLPAGCFNVLLSYTGRYLLGVELPKSHFSPEALLKNTTCPNFLQFLFLVYFSSNTSDSSDKQGARARPCGRTDGCVLWTCSSSPPLAERWNSVTAQNYRRKQSPQPCDGTVEVMLSDYFHLQLWNHNEEGSTQEPVYKAVLGYFFSSITFMDVLQSHCPDGHVTKLWQQKQPHYKCKGRAEEQTLNVYMNKNVLFIFTHGFTAQIPPEWIMTFGWQTYGNILNDTGIWLNHPMEKNAAISTG